jgi:hypothetical protein
MSAQPQVLRGVAGASRRGRWLKVLLVRVLVVRRWLRVLRVAAGASAQPQVLRGVAGASRRGRWLRVAAGAAPPGLLHNPSR